LRTKEEKARKDALSLVPRDLTAAATAWKDGKVTREEIEQLWRLLWGNDKSGDFFTYKGANVFDIITNDMLWDIEDCQAEIYFDLARVQFVGPFRYDSEEDQAEANIWRVRDTAFCAFAK
jgi:hypothetical protein